MNTLRISASTRNKRKSLRRRNLMVPAAFFARRIRFERALQGPMPSAAVRDEGALQMRPAPCGYSSACVLRPHFLFSLRKGNGVARQRKRGPRKTGSASRAAIASEEASSIPFPPGRRKLHIRGLLLTPRCAERRDLSGDRVLRNGQLESKIF